MKLKKLGGYKLNTYTSQKGSDVKTILDGVYAKDSSYVRTTHDGSTVVNSDFTDKTKTIKYWSGHGNVQGELWGNNTTASVTMTSSTKFSGGNLEFIFLSACNQLNGDSPNPRSWYAKSMIGASAVRAICGYHSYAPADCDNEVAKEFIKAANTGESVKSSWIKANVALADQGWTNPKNYLVLTHNNNTQYSRFEGFSTTTYTRPDANSTSILRFSSAYPNGTNQPYSAPMPIEIDQMKSVNVSKNSEFGVLDRMVVPNYTIIMEEVKDDTSLNASGEIGHTPLTITESEAKEVAMNRLNTTFNEKSSLSTAQLSVNGEFLQQEMNIEVAPIVMAEVLEDSSQEVEVPVAYTISYKNSLNGIQIAGDHYTTIVDDDGTKYNSFVWHRIKETIPVEQFEKTSAMNFSEASLLAYDVMESEGSSCDCEDTAYAQLMFVQNGGTNEYRPTWVFESKERGKIYVDCINHSVVSK
ncbi:MAG: DUF6345 domain-containing protein [Anaerorhabdus sp.]